jgi:hypothetical protein
MGGVAGGGGAQLGAARLVDLCPLACGWDAHATTVAHGRRGDNCSVSLVSILFVLAGCGGGSHTTDSTPQKLDGSESHEFEQDDIDRAGRASDAVKEYCANAVSEAQRLGCESHVTDDELP